MLRGERAAGRGKHSRCRKSSTYTTTHTRQAAHTTPHCLRSVNLPLVLSCGSRCCCCCMCCVCDMWGMFCMWPAQPSTHESRMPYGYTYSYSIRPDLSSCTQIYAKCFAPFATFLLGPLPHFRPALPRYINCSVFCPIRFLLCTFCPALAWKFN